MQERIVPGQLMLLDKKMRDHIAETFGVKQSGPCEVRDNEVISDGRTLADLSVITKEAMTAYVGSEETFGRLWEITCAKAYSELNPPVGEIAPVVPTEVEIAPEVENNTQTNEKTK